jgi:hypothetical protein
MLVISSTCFSLGQEAFSTYQSAIGKDSKVAISGKSEKDFILWIDAYSVDVLHKDAGFYIEAKQYNDFIIALMEAKEKYTEWKKVAVENDVKKLTKPMKLNIPKATGYFKTSTEWHFNRNGVLNFDFRILEISGETEYWLSIGMYSLVSSSNQYIKHDGVVITLSDASQIEAFISSMSYEKIVQHFQSANKKEALFGD